MRCLQLFVITNKRFMVLRDGKSCISMSSMQHSLYADYCRCKLVESQNTAREPLTSQFYQVLFGLVFFLYFVCVFFFFAVRALHAIRGSRFAFMTSTLFMRFSALSFRFLLHPGSAFKMAKIPKTVYRPSVRVGQTLEQSGQCFVPFG